MKHHDESEIICWTVVEKSKICAFIIIDNGIQTHPYTVSRIIFKAIINRSAQKIKLFMYNKLIENERMSRIRNENTTPPPPPSVWMMVVGWWYACNNICIVTTVSIFGIFCCDGLVRMHIDKSRICFTCTRRNVFGAGWSEPIEQNNNQNRQLA